jgi:uncharacterized protein (TIGR00730 family)
MNDQGQQKAREMTARRIRSICVFCGSSTGARTEFAASARRLGEVLAAQGLELVYGAGDVGLMGILADAALAAGGRVIGVIPQALMERELAHYGLSELHVVRTMHERKAMMADRAEAFLALPGGFGTADELFEILTWAQLGIHARPVGLLNVAGFFDPLLAWIDRAVAERFLREEHRAILHVGEQPEALLDLLLATHSFDLPEKWITGDDR